ncbi:MAG: O-antigen ligase family protein [Pseudomonadota bacterium]
MASGGWLDKLVSFWLFFWFAFIAVYIHFGGLAFAGLAILLGLVGWAVWFGQRPAFKAYDLLRPTICFAIFFIWLGLSGFWSGVGPQTAIRLAAQVALSISIPVLILSRSVWTQKLLSHLLMAMALGGAAVLALDVAAGYGINTFLDPLGPDGDLNKRQSDAEKNIGRGHVVYALLAPVLIALFATRLPRSRCGPVIVVFLALVLIGTMLNRLAVVPIILMGGCVFMVVGYRYPRWGLRLSLGTLAASILFAPLVGIAARAFGPQLMVQLPMSWDHRLRMWDYSLARIAEAPLTGKGLDSSRNLQDDFTTRIGVDIPFISLHPHNIGLQTWLETGLIGAVILTLAIGLLYNPLRHLSGDMAWRSSALSGTIMAIAVAGAVTVGAWQYWWWGLIMITLSLILLIPQEQRLQRDNLFDRDPG